MGRNGLDDATVLSLHRQYVHGRPITHIASELGIDPKTVRRYLHGVSKPNPLIARKIANIHGYSDIDLPREPNTPDGFITLREASRLVPFEPCPEILARHTRPGATPRLRAKIISTGRTAAERVLVTRTEWVKQWNAKRIGPHPRGIAIGIDAACEVIDPGIVPDCLLQHLPRHHGSLIKVGRRCCVMVNRLEKIILADWGGERRLSFPPGFMDAVRSRADASGTRLFVITRETLSTI